MKKKEGIAMKNKLYITNEESESTSLINKKGKPLTAEELYDESQRLEKVALRLTRDLRNAGRKRNAQAREELFWQLGDAIQSMQLVSLFIMKEGKKR